MRPDRIVALVILAFSVGYGWLAFHYPLLPFERHMAFKPSTMPMGLAVLGIVVSLAVLAFPGGSPDGLSDDGRHWRGYDWRTTAIIVALMVAYALAIRPVGYVPATTLFLAVASAVLGERRPVRLLVTAFVTAYATWYLVQETLGIFLKPWPWSG